MAEPDILYTPSPETIESAFATQFARQMVRKHHLELNSYADFHRWTIEHPETFWAEIWDFCGVIASRKGPTVLVDGDKMPGARWYPEARLNFAENLMRRGDRGDAFVLWDERGFQRRLSYSDLTSEVSRAAQALQALGLRAGDRAAAVIPNISGAAVVAPAALSPCILWSSRPPGLRVGPRRSSRTFRRPRCSRSPPCRLASSGPPARRTSAWRACSSASARSSPRSSSARTATATTARSTTACRASPRSPRSCPRCARS